MRVARCVHFTALGGAAIAVGLGWWWVFDCGIHDLCLQRIADPFALQKAAGLSGLALGAPILSAALCDLRWGRLRWLGLGIAAALGAVAVFVLGVQLYDWLFPPTLIPFIYAPI